MRPRGDLLSLLGAFLLSWPHVLAGQEVKPEEGTARVATARPVAVAVDPRFRSPRATVRTFLIAMNMTEDDPRKIEDAIACLDLSEIAPARRNGGRFAFELEFILRSTNIPTTVIPDEAEGKDCEIGEGKDIRLRLHRMPDERWLFEGKTLAGLPKMRLVLWENALTAGQGKDAGDVPAEFRSPYAMFRTYVAALKKGDLDQAAQCLDLTDIPDPARRIVGRELAFKLKEVLDRNVFVIFQDLPDTSVGLPLEAVVQKEGRITAERLVSGKRKGQWLFNRATVQSVDPLYDAFEAKPLVPELAATGHTVVGPTFRHTPGLWLRHHMPDWLRSRVGASKARSLAAYQVVGLILLVVLIVPIYRLVVWPLTRLLRTLMAWRSVPTDDRELRSWVRPIGWLVVSWLLVEGVTILDLRMEAAGSLLAVLVPLYWVAAALAVYQLIDPALRLIAGPALTQQGGSTLAMMGFPVVSLVLKILVVAGGLAALLNLFEFDVGTVVAGLGIGGLAFALAAQDTLKNFFGSLMLIADRTFRVGDLVQIGGTEGVVESVGLRSTRIRGLDDSLLTIPNSDLTTAHVTNFGARRCRRFQTQITVPYGTPPERLIEFRDGIQELIRQRPGARAEKYEVALNDLGSSGVEILIQVFFDVSDSHAELMARDGLILELVRLANRLGITFEKTSRPASK
ncbi:MAG TPA: mechanosensitive ion channel family protein [Isosphaeraceae bacterium]|nr:mechanosensitive ion channel family protein [Isosphaeraceae bacterium]